MVVDLQAIFEVAYDQGDYAESIDYDQPPSVALSSGDLQWEANVARRTPA